MLSRDKLLESFASLGITQGDTVFIRGNLGKVGRIKPQSLFLDTLLDVVGEGGTIVTLGFTKSFPVYKIDKEYIFDTNTPSTSGALAKLFMNHEKCIRSKHPSNSFLAIGKNAYIILGDHNEDSLSYAPMKKIIELDAKMVIFGIIEDSPGFTTVHYAQEMLGLTSKSFFKGLFKVYYRKGKEKKLFTRYDIGGCSAGFGKFYKYYISHDILSISKIGNAQAIIVDARSAYDIEYKLMSNNNSFHFCDDPLCLSCRASWTYDFKYLPTFVVLKIYHVIKGLFK